MEEKSLGVLWEEMEKDEFFHQMLLWEEKEEKRL